MWKHIKRPKMSWSGTINIYTDQFYSVCVHTRACVCMSCHVEVRGQPAAVSLLLPPHGDRGLSAGHQVSGKCSLSSFPGPSPGQESFYYILFGC